MTFQPKHVVTMVACVSAAVVLAPVGVMAATGTLVNITDAAYSSRKARVSADGSLRVEQRAAATTNTFNRSSAGVNSLSFAKLIEVSGPRRLAITDLSFSADTFTSQATAGYAARLEFVALIRKSGTSACAYNASGWTRTTLRWVDIAPTQTNQLSFSGSPLVPPVATGGEDTCIGFQVWVLPANTTIFAGVSGYTYEP